MITYIFMLSFLVSVTSVLDIFDKGEANLNNILQFLLFTPITIWALGQLLGAP